MGVLIQPSELHTMTDLGTNGCWVAYNYDDRLAVIAVFADELSARRWAMDHYSPTTAVTYLPYGVDISDHLPK